MKQYERYTVAPATYHVDCADGQQYYDELPREDAAHWEDVRPEADGLVWTVYGSDDSDQSEKYWVCDCPDEDTAEAIAESLSIVEVVAL